MSDYLKLIERLEKAHGHDRDLNGEIAVAVGLFARPPKVLVPPDYTDSVDAALTLIPEGWYWSLDSRGCAVVGKKEPSVTKRNAPWYSFCQGHEKPAIALCIAALRAKDVEENRPELNGDRSSSVA